VATFESIQNYAKSVGSEVLSVPLGEGFVHDVSAWLDGQAGLQGSFNVCNPDNPTATVTPRKDLDSFIGRLPATTKSLIDEHTITYGAVGRVCVFLSIVPWMTTGSS